MSQAKPPSVDPDAVDEYADAQPLDDQERVRLETQIHQLKDKLRRSDADVHLLRQELWLSERRIELLASANEPVRAPKIRPKGKGKRNQATAFLIASDWHVEEQVDPKTVNFRNEYNPEVAEERGELFFKNSLRLIEIQRCGTQIDTVVLALLGDMVSGYIHEELVEANYLSPTEAIRLAQRMLVRGIDLLLSRGDLERLVIPCCFGNHGRTTNKRRISTGSKNSFEWLMYHTLADHYRGESRVEFIIADGAHVYLDCYGVEVRFTHGDDLRYQGGIGGITIPLRKATDSWDQFKRAGLTVFGHWHVLDNYGAWAVGNGSLIGYNAYALSIKARFEPPQQAFFLIDSERKRKTGAFPIFVT